jgi:hypothetical protein
MRRCCVHGVGQSNVDRPHHTVAQSYNNIMIVACQRRPKEERIIYIREFKRLESIPTFIIVFTPA